MTRAGDAESPAARLFEGAGGVMVEGRAEEMPDASATPSAEAAAMLLERSRAHWQMGEWETLTALAEQPLDDYPERAKLALLAAVGFAQSGNMTQARHYARKAQVWGCARELLARVLIGGVYNSLGRAASLNGEENRAAAFFETSIATVSPRDDAKVLGRARNIREKARLGQLPEAAKLIGEDLQQVQGTVPGPDALQSLDKRLQVIEAQLTVRQKKSDTSFTAQFVPEDVAYFRSYFSDGKMDRDMPRLLEVKSLPRSGLHFLKSCLQTVLGARFSFCEWYLEPGCCRRQPCALARPALADENPDHPRLRMIKSHDFEQTDQAYLTPPGIQRLVLLRDPMMILTSWWMLEELNRHAASLRENGLNPQQLFYLHERSALKRAYELVAERFVPLPEGHLERWLKAKTTYAGRFLEKWTREEIPGTTVLKYEDLPEFILRFFERPGLSLSAIEQEALNRLQRETLSRFAGRTTPFDAPVAQVAEVLKHHAGAFRQAAETIREKDGSGLL